MSHPGSRDARSWADSLSAPDVRPFPATWRLMNDVEIMALPDPVFLVNGIIQDAAVGVLYSPPGAGKTTAVASLAVSIATGGRWLGHAVLDPGAVVYVAAEDPSGFKVRLRAAKVAAGLRLDLALGVYTFPESIDLCDSGSVARFRAFLAEQRFDGLPLKLIVIDTYAAATPGAAENSSEATTTAMTHAQQWRDALGCTVLFLHHTNAQGSRERGHSAMRGAADFMISMTPADDLIYLDCSKNRNGAPFDRMTLKLTDVPEVPGKVLRLASEVLPSPRLTSNEQRALETLGQSFGTKGATRAEWQAACAGIAQSTWYRATKTLVDRGLVEEVNGSRYRLSGAENP